MIKQKALLIIDVQNAMFTYEKANPNAESPDCSIN
jgi:hypothetical protein